VPVGGLRSGLLAVGPRGFVVVVGEIVIVVENGVAGV